MKVATKTIVALIAVIVLVVAAMALSGRPTLLSLTDPGELRRPSLTIFNPLRDKASEQAAERILDRLRSGAVDDALVAIQQTDIERLTIQRKERLHPLRGWALTNRLDRDSDVTLFYRTVRGTSTELDSSVTIYLTFRTGEWVVTGFRPVY